MMPPCNIRLKVQLYLLTYTNKRKLKLIERALHKRGSNIRDFLNNSGYDQNSMTRLIATKKHSRSKRSMILATKSVEESQQIIRNTLIKLCRSSKIIWDYSKFVPLCNVFDPTRFTAWENRFVDKHDYTSKWLEDHNLKL